MLTLVKIAVNVALITGITEVVKRNLVAAALLGALPIVSIISMIWMHVEGRELEKISEYSTPTFWLVLPTLPMFLIFPALVRGGLAFWPAMLLSIVSMLILYGLLVLILKATGLAF